ncbi:MAG: hypothetical protein ACLSHG_13510 [Oscillospiraceae bacterium]
MHRCIHAVVAPDRRPRATASAYRRASAATKLIEGGGRSAQPPRARPERAGAARAQHRRRWRTRRGLDRNAAHRGHALRRSSRASVAAYRGQVPREPRARALHAASTAS